MFLVHSELREVSGLILETALAAIIGAAVGAYLNHRLPRAIPMILVHSIELSTALVDPDEIVQKQALIRELNEFPYPIGVRPIRGRIKTGEWLESLETASASLEDLLADLDETESAVGKARQLVAAEDFITARPEIASQHLLWHLIEGGYERSREDVFSRDAIERLDHIESTDSLIDIDNDGFVLVRVEGSGKSLMLDWKDIQPSSRKNTAKELARRCGLAVATNDEDYSKVLSSIAAPAAYEIVIE